MKKNPPLVSVIIPTFNRFEYVLRSLESIQGQTFKDFEVIIVNDSSSQEGYYKHDWSGVKILHLSKNSKEIAGYPCAGFVRNEGVKHAEGKYIAFCDDDDVWHPQKLETQLASIQDSPCRISCTNYFVSLGKFEINKKHPTYLERFNNSFRQKGIPTNLSEIPDVWDKGLVSLHNIIGTSTVLLEKSLMDSVDGFGNLPNGQEDYDLWLRCLDFSSILFIKKPLAYYDTQHGSGRHWKPYGKK